jgi:hypothetical protein
MNEIAQFFALHARHYPVRFVTTRASAMTCSHFSKNETMDDLHPFKGIAKLWCMLLFREVVE